MGLEKSNAKEGTMRRDMIGVPDFSTIEISVYTSATNSSRGLGRCC